MSRSKSLRRRAVSDLKCAPKRAHCTRRLQAAIESLEIRVLLSTYTVNTFVDQADWSGSAGVSLRDALAKAAANPGADTINLPAGNYKLKLGELRVSDTSGAVTIQAVGGTAVIDAGGKSRVLDIGVGSIVSASGLKITGGNESFDYDYGSGVLNSGTLTLTHSVITGNKKGGIQNSATAILNNDTISDNSGAVVNEGLITIAASTISGNTAQAGVVGDGVDNEGYGSLVQVTVADNVGVGVSNGSHLTLTNCTISGNTQGGISDGGVYCAAGNNIIAGNGQDFSASNSCSVTSLGGNIIGDIGSSTGWLASDKTGTDAKPLDALLSPLGNFGGATQTMIPTGASPALRAGRVSNVPKGLVGDQRGYPRVVAGAVDAGAIEAQGGPIVITPAKAQSTTAGTAFAVALGSFSAPAGKQPFDVTIAWGDGSPDTTFVQTNAGAISSQKHQFLATGDFNVTAAVTDRTGDLSNAETIKVAVSAKPKISLVVNTGKSQTDLAGSSVMSLQDAVARADAAFGPVSISFAPTVFATARTIDGGFEISNRYGAVTIVGPAAGVTIAKLTVDPSAVLSMSHVNVIGASSGVCVTNNGTLTLSQSNIADGSAYNGGDIVNTGTLVLSASTVSGGLGNGGGLLNSGTADVSGCTFADDTSYSGDYYQGNGGAISNSGVLNLVDSTLTGNNASGGAGLYNTGKATVNDCTITNGSYEDNLLDNEPGATLVLGNSIIADNSKLFGNDDVAGTITSQGHNFVSETADGSGWVASDKVGSPSSPLDAELSALGTYGGPTQTQPPLPGSPALGVGSTAIIPSGVTADQRGFARVVNGKADIGAYETQAASTIMLTTTPPSLQKVVAGTATSIQLGTFADATAGGPFTIMTSWGDGSNDTSFVMTKPGKIVESHAFRETGLISGSYYIVDGAGDVSKVIDFSVASSTATPIVFTVNTTKAWVDAANSPIVSLVDAVDRADASFGPVTIQFDPTVFATKQTIDIGGMLELSNKFGVVNIIGPSAGLTVDAALQVDTTAAAQVTGITICGGGVTNNGTLQMSHCLVTGVDSTVPGVRNWGSMTLSDSTVSGNTDDYVVEPGYRGPPWAYGGYGGGVINDGTLTVTRCSISNNSSNGTGGGITNNDNATLVVSASTIADNSLENGYQRLSAGGGICNNGSVSLTNCTIAGNSASDGGGVENGYDGTATITNCTISNNSASNLYWGGGGIDNSGTLTLANSIVAGNTEPAATNAIEQSDIAPDVYGQITSSGHNLIGETDNSSGWVASDLTGTVAKPLDAGLAPLGNLGGPTQTLGLLPGSPARSAGSVSLLLKGDSVDQRGFSRIVGGKVDIGAFQTQNLKAVTLTLPAAQSAAYGVSSSFSLGSFADSASAGPFAVSVDWGDGSPQAHFSVSSAGSLGTLSHTFTAVGTMTQSVTIVDPAGNWTSGAYTIVCKPAALKTIVVNTTRDVTDAAGSKTVSLRDAVSLADAWFGPVDITFDPTVFSVAQIITLQAPDPVSHDYLELRNNRSGLISIDGPAAGLTLQANSDGAILLAVDANVAAAVNNLDFINGQMNVQADGALTMDDSIVTGNSTSDGLQNAGVATLADDAFTGADIFNSGNLDLRNSAISVGQWYGGTGVNNTGAMTIADSTISGWDSGGVTNAGTMTIDASTISANQYRTEIGQPGTNITTGGGISNFSGGILTITNSTVFDNSSSSWNLAGNVDSDGVLTMTDCTVAGDAGGVSLGQNGSTTLIGCTIVAGTSDNSRAALLESWVDVTIGNSVIVGTAFTEGGYLNSLGHNFVSDGNADTWAASDTVGTASQPLDAKLSALGDHGGPTETIVPLAGSPLLGAGSTALIPSGDVTDQRGDSRVVQKKVDIGAVQTEPGNIVVTAPSAQRAVAGVATSVSLGSFAETKAAGPYTAIVDWGDGSPDSTFNLSSAGGLGAQKHTFVAVGSLTVTVDVVNRAGAISNDSTFTVLAAQGRIIWPGVAIKALSAGSRDCERL